MSPVECRLVVGVLALVILQGILQARRWGNSGLVSTPHPLPPSLPPPRNLPVIWCLCRHHSYWMQRYNGKLSFTTLSGHELGNQDLDDSASRRTHRAIEGSSDVSVGTISCKILPGFLLQTCEMKSGGMGLG